MKFEELRTSHLGICKYEGCGFLLISKSRWTSLTATERRAAKKDGYARHQSRRLCDRHLAAVMKAGNLEQYPARPEVSEIDFHALYEKHAEDPYPPKRIADEIGMSVQNVQRLLRKNGISYKLGQRGPAAAIARRTYILEEVEFFLSMDRGVSEISAALHYAPGELIQLIDGWRAAGHTTIDLRYGDRNDGRAHNQYTNA